MAKKEQTSKSKLKKIKFLRSPTGAYNLAYSAGQEAEFEAKLADELIETKFAEAV